MTNQNKNNYLFPLIVMASLFFLFGFITTMNNSTIDFLKKAFGLDDFQKQLTNTFFYGAYILSVPIGILLNRIGYKNGILFGLALVVIGFFLCIPGVAIGYYGFLSAVSVFAIGVVLLQVSANPYVNALGNPETAASRLTLTNALNSVATVLGSLFVSVLLVTPKLEPGIKMENSAIQHIVKGPFMFIGIVTAIIFVIMIFLKLPEIKTEDNQTEDYEKKAYKSSAFKYPHVWLGSLAIFLYMGIEIGISSFFPDYAKLLNIKNIKGADMLWVYWTGMMVGRIVGIFVLRKFKARQILSICAIGGAILLGSSFAVSSSIPVLAMWLFLTTGLFHSIMWPVIYNLALEDLGPHAKVASGVIATSVIGASILTLLMGKIQVLTGSVIVAVSLLFIYYLYMIFFALKGSTIRTAN